MSNDFIFADEIDSQPIQPRRSDVDGWKVLIVDDEREVHAVTRLALMELSFEGRGLHFLSAHTRAEAEDLVLQHPDIAIVLLDVVMDTDDAGLQVARFIRDEAHNQKARIILRTGQPGQAPERTVVLNYDINDYKSKTELTSQKLFTCVMSALRSYRDIIRVEAKLQDRERTLSAFAHFIQSNHPNSWNEAVAQLPELESFIQLKTEES